MDRYERILTLHRILKTARVPVSLSHLMERLNCSRATLYRDIAFLRDSLGAPIDSQTDQSAFSYGADEAKTFELPGLWLNSDELQALLTMQQLLSKTGPGVLSTALAPLRSRIEELLSDRRNGKPWPLERIRVTGVRRLLNEESFRIIASSVLERKRLAFKYRARSTENDTQREVSPQRLTYYRDAWYLDAFDHNREALRSFALDRVAQAKIMDSDADDLADAELDNQLASSYGIFSGPPKAWAVLRFSKTAARWVAEETWHPNQQGQWLDDGSYELKIPYSNARELLMDVLRFGPDAQVISPVPLREEAKIMLRLALGNYESSVK